MNISLDKTYASMIESHCGVETVVFGVQDLLSVMSLENRRFSTVPKFLKRGVKAFRAQTYYSVIILFMVSEF